MTLRVSLNHRTEYRYDAPVLLGPHVVRLRPAPHCRTPIHAFRLRVDPGEHWVNWQQDPYGNYMARLLFREPTRSLRFEVDLVAELSVINPFDFFIDPSAEKFPFAYDPVVARELIPYLETLPPDERLTNLIVSQSRQGLKTVDFLVGLNQHLQRLIKYEIRLEPGVQTPEETLRLGRGSCRDTAWLLVQLLRHLGLAARFVSGYLIQLTADQKALDGPDGPTTDFTDLHAWAEVYLPGAGWVGLDPTSGLLTGEGHIPLACTADPASAAAISGGLIWQTPDGMPIPGGDHFSFHMEVKRIEESPRVTKPYTESQWEAIDRLGQQVDADLKAGDVRLTMGGEPTFVGIDDPDSVEWNYSALGPAKRRVAGDLLRRLRDRFAPSGFLHFGFGKWYPGEPLPRWSLGCYWRADGTPIWLNPRLVADEKFDYGCGTDQAQNFIQALASRLAVNPYHAIPGFEDVWYYMWRERRLPANVDPLQSKLEDKLERERLARIFESQLGKVTGYALPLRCDTGRWQSGRWFFRQENMFLLPGDSPMGLRLPLDSLPWLAPEARQPFYEVDPFAPRPQLPPRHIPLRQQHLRAHDEGTAVNGRYSEQRLSGPDFPFSTDAADTIRTALCVEPRDGTLHVFMPPVRYVGDYLNLVSAIEETSEALQLPVRVEGYAPPQDARIRNFKLTPDPGVIEVNIQPSHSWKELVDTTTTLYDEARQSRLAAEKFMLDGRHTGTGGGNHILLGGMTPADSPLLRRPDLLRSLLGYWHNHPALSYLFSGLFIGPTSQAPRVDEARNDSLHELETAFQQVSGESPTSPWLVDRVFRHLLTDATGNTHRTEFCIDKLYSPDTSSGRLGLLEMRAFEMPPHSRMSLVQQLLLRSLVARFWRDPYEQRLVRWRTELHDRFMLPHFVQQDFRDVLDDLGHAGYGFDPEWFAPFMEFRFPLFGHVTMAGVDVELRQALEPWPVLGEEPGAGGTVRGVDSSVERLQVMVRGMTEPRHLVTCNGRRLPLHPTGTNGEFVAGVRFRAWQPPSCLHPTIPVHAPLVIDLIDSWNGRSVGGCTYHVSHPGGLGFERFPVNSNEAQSRRTARFMPWGHTPGPVVVPTEEPLPDFPFTLDLRREPSVHQTPNPTEGYTYPARRNDGWARVTSAHR
jgi:uncharacterized protein (DUF2126 family)/transglutaminase-like putative cysteine protease